MSKETHSQKASNGKKELSEKQNSNKSTQQNSQIEVGSPVDKVERKTKLNDAKTAKLSPSTINYLILSFIGLLVVILSVNSFWNRHKLAGIKSDALIYQQEAENNIQNISERLDVMASNLDLNNKENNQKFVSTDNALKNVFEQLGRSTTGWIVAEAEYLMTIANNRILLEHDVKTAIAALAASDERLQDIGDPLFFNVRQILSNELNSLKSIEIPDIEGISMGLVTLAERVETLPFYVIASQAVHIPNDETNEQTEKNWQQVVDNLWDNFQQLVVIRRIDQPVTPLLVPEQKQFLVQNLMLKLGFARLALHRRQTEEFHNNLVEAKKWTLAYFENSSTEVKHFVSQLKDLEKLDITPKLPDISASLRSLRQLKQSGQMSLIQQSNSPSFSKKSSAPGLIINEESLSGTHVGHDG